MYQRSVSINLDSKCNATCDHCCFSCSPKSSLKMEESYIKKQILEFSKNPKIEVISFTGGEIFLNYSLLKELMIITHTYGKKITLITNGFWGSSRKLISEYFADFDKYNVVALTISYDEYHSPFVKLKSVKNILDHRLLYPNIDVSLNMAVTKDKMSHNILEELGDAVLGMKITKFPLITVGAAKEKINKEIMHNFYNLFENRNLLNCPGFEIVYHHDGEIYPCCSPAIFETKITLREDEDQTFERTIEKLNTNLLLYIIRKEGFKWFIEILESQKLIDKFGIPYEYPSVCSVCGSLFNTIEKIEFFKPYMEEYYENIKV